MRSWRRIVDPETDRADPKARYMAQRTQARIDEAAEQGTDFTEGLDVDLAAQMVGYFLAARLAIPPELARFVGAGRPGKKGPNPFSNRQRDAAVIGAIRELAERGIPLKDAMDGLDAFSLVADEMCMSPRNVERVWREGPGLHKDSSRKSRH